MTESKTEPKNKKRDKANRNKNDNINKIIIKSMETKNGVTKVKPKTNINYGKLTGKKRKEKK